MRLVIIYIVILFNVLSGTGALAQQNADSFNFSVDTSYVSDSLYTDSIYQVTSARKVGSYGLMVYPDQRHVY